MTATGWTGWEGEVLGGGGKDEVKERVHEESI